MTSAASGGERGAGRRGCKRRHVRVRGSGMHGAASGRRAWEARADSVTGATKWQSREGGRVSPPPGAPGSCHSPGGGRATGRGHAPPRGRLERMAPGGRAGTALAARWTGCPVDWPAATGLGKEIAEEAGSLATRASAGEEEKRAGQGLLERGQRARSCGCSCCHGNWGPDVATLGCDRPLACRQSPEACPVSHWNGVVLSHVERNCTRGSKASPRARRGERGTL